MKKSSAAFCLSKPQLESSEIIFSTSAAAKSSSKSRSVIVSSGSIKSGMSFWLICLSTFSWACLSVPYWIVKSQHCYTYVTRTWCTFVMALVGAALFVLLNTTFEKLGLALGITFLAALIQTIKKEGFGTKVQRMRGRNLSEASPYATWPLAFQAWV